MAEVLPPTHTASMENSQDSIGGDLYSNSRRISAPAPNPHFSFPMLPPADTLSSSDYPEPEGASIRALTHKSRPANISVGPLPTPGFSQISPGKTPTSFGSSEPSPTRSIPIRSGGHRREGSQFIGGGGTIAGPGLLSTSPTKGEGMLPSPPTSGRRRGHAHRRSGAISSHDVTSMLRPNSHGGGMFSGSAPNSPADPNRHEQFRPSIDHAASVPNLNEQTQWNSNFNLHSDNSGSVQTSWPQPTASSQFNTPRKERENMWDDDGQVHTPDLVATPRTAPGSQSRPKVGFSEEIEIIPRGRPLSTISSETSSSLSTVRPISHSVTGSINSLMSYNTSSPPSAKKQQYTAEALREYRSDSPRPRTAESPLSASPLQEPFEQDEPAQSRPSSAGAGYALKKACEDIEPSNPSAESTTPSNEVTASAAGYTAAYDFATQHTSSPSESTSQPLRRFPDHHDVDLSQRPRSSPEAKSTKKHKMVKTWAGSLLSRKAKTKSTEALDENSEISKPFREFKEEPEVKSAQLREFAPMEEFSLDDIDFDEDTTCVIRSPDYEPPSSAKSVNDATWLVRDDTDADVPGVLDLDATWRALDVVGPASTSAAGKRRTMHSSGSTGGFVGPGMHYHRRAESAPALTPVAESTAFNRTSNSPQMADVFEEDEEEDAASKGLKAKTHAVRPSAEERELLGLGVKIVDSDEHLPETAVQRRNQHRTEAVEPDLSSNRSGDLLKLEAAAAPSPISPQDFFQSADIPVEVVDSVDEPRFSVVTKSSDESTITPTLQDSRQTRSAPSAISIGRDSADQPYRNLDTPILNSSNPSPDPRHLSFDGPRLHTAASSITDRSAWSGAPNNFASTEDVPSLTSSASTMISGQPQMSPRFPAARPSGERSFSFSAAMPRTTRPTSGAGKRSSLASLSRLMVSSSIGEKSKLSVEAFAPEEGDKTDKKKRHRLSKLMRFWKSKEKLRDSAIE